uniref:Uncharacterized protein n=1 Tax=Arundo donax TaxID=35708 RepID=A0A0A9EA85_ARUDO
MVWQWLVNDNCAITSSALPQWKSRMYQFANEITSVTLTSAKDEN